MSLFIWFPGRVLLNIGKPSSDKCITTFDEVLGNVNILSELFTASKRSIKDLKLHFIWYKSVKVEAHLWRVWVCYQLVLSAGIICLQLTRGAERGWRPGAGEQFTIHCKYCNVLPLSGTFKEKCKMLVLCGGEWSVASILFSASILILSLQNMKGKVGFHCLRRQIFYTKI